MDCLRSRIVQLATVRIGGDPAAWEALGFTVDGGAIALANGEIRFEGDVPGVSGLVAGAAPPAATHANGALWLDHVVLTTRSLDDASARVEAEFGLPRRRVREAGPTRYAFHRFERVGEAPGCIVEIVERADAAERWWGLVVVVADLEALGYAPRPAVQPGRSIATVPHTSGLGFPVALMTP